MTDVDTPPRTLSSTELVAACPGLTYRMLDYWCRTGQLGPGIGAAHGSGTARRFEADVIPLIRAGLILAAFKLNGDARRNALARIRTAIQNRVHEQHPDGALTFDPDGYPAAHDTPRIVIPLAYLTTT